VVRAGSAPAMVHATPRLGVASATLASQVMSAMKSAARALQKLVQIAMDMESVSLASAPAHQDGEEQSKAPWV